MKTRIFLVGLSAMFLFGCTMLGTKETSETNKQPEAKTEVKKTAKPNVGDTVVAKWSQNSFFEGKVESVTDAKIKINWSDGSNASEVDAADVYPLPKAGEKPDVKVGDIVLAKISSGNYWNGAEITKVEGDVYAVKVINGESSNLSSEKIIKIPAAVAANFKEEAKQGDFLKAAQANKPTPPADFKPKAGDKVLGEWATNSWYQAKVQKVVGSKATLAWEDGSKPSEVDLEKVLPMPDAKTEMPKENQYLLVKPESGTKWYYAQAVSVKDGNVEVKSSDGKTRTVKAGAYILLN